MDDIQINTTTTTIAKKSNGGVKRKNGGSQADVKIKKFKSNDSTTNGDSKGAKFSSLFKNNAQIPVIKK